MDSKAELHTFPKTADEALALLYLQSRDLSDATPESLYDDYKDACDRIRKHRHSSGQPQKISY